MPIQAHLGEHLSHLTLQQGAPGPGTATPSEKLGRTVGRAWRAAGERGKLHPHSQLLPIPPITASRQISGWH